MKAIYAFLILVLIFSKSSYSQQGNKHNLTGSIWVCKIAGGCTDSLIFKSNKLVKEYSCEQDYSSKNRYTVVGDTLIITEADNSHTEDNGKISYYRYKYMIKSNELKLFSIGEFISHKWKYRRNNSSYTFRRILTR